MQDAQENYILLPGWSRNAASYKKLTATGALKGEKIHVLSYQEILPSKGMDGISENIEEFLRAHDMSSVKLIGHSLGGPLAIDFAYRHQEQVEKLFLVDSEGVCGGESLADSFFCLLQTSFQHGGKKAGENVKALSRAALHPVSYKNLASFATSLDLQEHAKALHVPVSLLWGENDKLTPLWQGERLHDLIPGSELVVLEDMDHDWILHSPEKFWEYVV